MASEQWSRTMDLVDEIKLKLAQANAICNVTRTSTLDGAIEHVEYVMLAATDLIEASQKAFDELWETVIKKTHA
ncbi:MAG: hypothetical protein ACREWE_00200 [Gammaproteobacteria bacterium]